MAEQEFDFSVLGAEEQLSNPMKQLRDHAKSVTDELKAAKKELAEKTKLIEGYQTKEKVTTFEPVLEKLGLQKQVANLILKTDPDLEPSEDAIKNWATENGLVAAAPPGEGGDNNDGEQKDQKYFAPGSAAGTAEPPGAKRYTRQEFDALLRENHERAMQVLREGRVELQTTLRPK